MNKVNVILDYFDEIIKEPKCELDYTKDYELLISIMLSAQTTDKRVNKVTKVLFKKYKTLEELSNSKLEDIEKIIRELGNYRKKSCAVIEISNILINEYNGIVPKERKKLEALPMIGRKTTNVFLSEFYNIPNIAVDTHVERVSKRLSLAKESDNVLKVEEKLRRKIPKNKWNKFHLQAVLFGRYHCTAKKPSCENCKLRSLCKKNEEI